MIRRVQLVVIVLLVMHDRAKCEQPPPPVAAENSPSPPAETAALIGVRREIEEIGALRPSGPAGSQQQWRALALHQRIYERVMMASLEVDATTAAIDNEIARATEVRGFLADKRDRTVSRANLLSALVGGGLGATSVGLQLSSRLTNATVATGVTGGVISAGLAVYGIRAQRGGTRMFDADSNMLAEFFDRPELPGSHYPTVVWEFLSEVSHDDPDRLTRRERLMHTWLELKRLDPVSTPSGKVKIEHITSKPDEHLSQTVDDLEDRIAMLQDVRAKLSYLKRDLAALLASLPDLNQDDNSSPRLR